MNNYGVSFSVKYAREMSVDPTSCLTEALSNLGVRRLRLMSYWDVHEPVFGEYDFTQLDWQIELAEKYGAEVSLCLGLRQPRWPESHWPAWAKDLTDVEWQPALLNYIEAVIVRYKGKNCIKSYQLENEALLKAFGLNGNYDRNRLKREFKLVKSLDNKRPVIMSTSDSGGFPFFGPKPDRLKTRTLLRGLQPRQSPSAILWYSARHSGFAMAVWLSRARRCKIRVTANSNFFPLRV